MDICSLITYEIRIELHRIYIKPDYDKYSCLISARQIVQKRRLSVFERTKTRKRLLLLSAWLDFRDTETLNQININSLS